MKNRILVLVLKAWAIGLLFGGLIALPLMTATRGISFANLGDKMTTQISVFFSVMPSGILLAFTFGLILSFPLALIALVVALGLSKAIAKHPIAFVVLAPLFTATLVASIDAATRNNSWANSHHFGEKFWHILLSWDTWVFAFPVLPASIYFCCFLPKVALLKTKRTATLQR